MGETGLNTYKNGKYRVKFSQYEVNTRNAHKGERTKYQVPSIYIIKTLKRSRNMQLDTHIGRTFFLKATL
jgi:hypothetical protein